MTDFPDWREYRSDRTLENFSAQWDRTSYSISGGTKGYPVLSMTDAWYGRRDFSRNWVNKPPVSNFSEFRGDVRSFSNNWATSTITVDDLCYKLKQTKIIPTQYDNLRNVVVNLFKLCDYEPLFIDQWVKSEVYNPIIMAPGGKYNVWDYLNTLLTVHNLYISRQNEKIVLLREPIQDIYPMWNVTSHSYNVDMSSSTKKIKTTFRPMHYRYDAYLPLSKESKDTIIQVEARKVTEQVLTLDAYAVNLTYPWITDCKDYMGPKGDPDSQFTAYCVSGNDGLPITPSQWYGQGGALSVRLNPENHNQVIVTVTGPQSSDYSPFRIAASSGPSNYYNSLRIRGTGLVMGAEEVYEAYTGSSSLGSDEEQINTPLINTPSLAIDNTLRAIWEKSGSLPTITISSPDFFNQDPKMRGNDFFLAAGSTFHYGDDSCMITHVEHNPQEMTLTATPLVTCNDVSNKYSDDKYTFKVRDIDYNMPKDLENVFQANQPWEDFRGR